MLHIAPIKFCMTIFHSFGSRFLVFTRLYITIKWAILTGWWRPHNGAESSGRRRIGRSCVETIFFSVSKADLRFGRPANRNSGSKGKRDGWRMSNTMSTDKTICPCSDNIFSALAEVARSHVTAARCSLSVSSPHYAESSTADQKSQTDTYIQGEEGGGGGVVGIYRRGRREVKSWDHPHPAASRRFPDSLLLLPGNLTLQLPLPVIDQQRLWACLPTIPCSLTGTPCL